MISLEVIQTAPEKVGVYLFKKTSRVLYVGKAKNIKDRLLQHFRQMEKDNKERSIIKGSDSVEWILTRNEFEALTLEIDLIQLHKPKYNVLHKYGSGYPLLVITGEDYPTVKVSRGKDLQEKAFGPFFSVGKARKIKKLIHKLFKIRTCDPMPIRREPCMDYHLGLCSAPCCGYISKREYNLAVRSAMSLLSGDVSSVLEELYMAIEEYSSNLQFEKCAQIRDQIYALENLAKGQKVSGIPLRHGDIFYSVGKMLGIFLIRTSKLVDKQIVYLEREEEREEVLLGFYYANPLSERVITNFELSDDVKEWLKKRGNPEFLIKIDREIEDIIRKNVGHHIDLKALEEEFMRKLHVPMPKVIEGFDVSHFYGEYTVGSCVVWKGGIMDKRGYRRYRIKSSKMMDDYSSLREVLTRRAKRLRYKDEVMPDAWLIDGGYAQLNVAVSIKREFGLPIHVFALAKEKEMLLSEKGMEVSLKDNLLLYRVFGLIRDEAHRFALAYNRSLRLKEGMKDVLSHIKGIGEVKRKLIYRNFENLYEFLEADEQRLKRLGINPSLKQEVKKYLSGSS